MNEHTPGPWVVKRNPANRHSWVVYDTKIRSHGFPARIATTAHWVPSDPAEESEANARLIAAAPDLLAELKRLSETRDVCLCDDLYEADRPCDCCSIAAAIAKAETGS